MQKGIRVFLPNKNRTKTQRNDPRNETFDSRLLHLKTAKSGTINKVVNAHSNTTEVIDHQLGVNPLVMGFYRDISDQKWFITLSQPAATTLGRPLTNVNVSIGVTQKKIVFLFNNNSGAQKTVELEYEIFYEGK